MTRTTCASSPGFTGSGVAVGGTGVGVGGTGVSVGGTAVAVGGIGVVVTVGGALVAVGRSAVAVARAAVVAVAVWIVCALTADNPAGVGVAVVGADDSVTVAAVAVCLESAVSASDVSDEHPDSNRSAVMTSDTNRVLVRLTTTLPRFMNLTA